ncbi:MAG: HAMP domain-containing sensor histidine kinase [Acidimicrobiia bacterium]
MMLGRPSLRRRLILSYLAVVIVVTAAAFVTVQVLVPEFFEQAVQQRLGPGPQIGQSDTPGQSGGDSTTTTTPASTPSSREPAAPTPTGSTIGPGRSDTGSGSQGTTEGDGQTRNPGNGNGPPTTTVDSFAGPGIYAAGAAAASTDRSPIPIEIQQDYEHALTAALIVAIAIGLVIALLLGWLLTRRLLRTFTGVKEGAAELAAGHYSVRIPVPAEVELAELAASINTLADSLERTEQTRARLVSDLAHEIRNPLSTIEGYMEGLIDGVLPASRDTYEAVAAEAHRLKRLTRDLTTLSKAQEGAIAYEMTPHDLGEIVAAVADTLQPQYEINDVALSVSMPGPMPVHVDDTRIAQTVTNLLGNALSHTPQGGQVTVRGTVDATWCRVSVADTGPGIPESQLETIFERFTRLDRTQPGTGIGLNIARTLARAHGGDVTATSVEGDGACFELRLPHSAA